MENNQQLQNKDVNYIAYFNGPILFSAPHSCDFVVPENVPDDGKLRTNRNHKKESYTMTIAVAISNKINQI